MGIQKIAKINSGSVKKRFGDKENKRLDNGSPIKTFKEIEKLNGFVYQSLLRIHPKRFCLNRFSPSVRIAGWLRNE
jgi:hypothetical protein